VQSARRHCGSSPDKSHHSRHRHSNRFRKNNEAHNEVSVMRDQGKEVVHGVGSQDYHATRSPDDAP
jgi:hypothetical protein